jgi:hypothetical protein
MAPDVMGDLQSLVTTLLNNLVGTDVSDTRGMVVNGDLQGVATRFGKIQFPLDLYISARDIPTAAIVYSQSGTSRATTTNPSPPASVAVASSSAAVAGSAWSTAWLGVYTYAVASTDESSNESVLTYSAATTALTADYAYTLTITPPTANDMFAFRIFRSGMGYSASTPAPGSFRYIGAVASNGTSTVSFVDLNTHIPGSTTIFLLDMNEEDKALDFRYLLPLTKIELFANNLYMPWAVAMIGAIRVKVPKFHGLIKNYVPTTASWDPLKATNTV